METATPTLVPDSPLYKLKEGSYKGQINNVNVKIKVVVDTDDKVIYAYKMRVGKMVFLPLTEVIKTVEKL